MIKIKAFQRKGIECIELVDKFDFCCWDSLSKWMSNFVLHKCPKCEKEKLEHQNP